MKFLAMGFPGQSPCDCGLSIFFAHGSVCPLNSFSGDANDDFIVELSPHTRGGQDKHKARKRLRTLRSHFRLRHAMTGCYLFSHKVKLPEWGFEQQEVGVCVVSQRRVLPRINCSVRNR